MADIKHLFHINAPRDNVFGAISTIDGLASWWTTQTNGQSKPDGTIEFRFGDQFFNKMKVKEMKTNETVSWQCTGGADEWVGRRFRSGWMRTKERPGSGSRTPGGKKRGTFIHNVTLAGDGLWKV
jgi:uncharacterized protein YndB with AHSA1/START domain